MTNPQNQTAAVNADVLEAVCGMGDAARRAQARLSQSNTAAKNRLL